GDLGIWLSAVLYQGVAVALGNRLVIIQPDGKLAGLTLLGQAVRVCPTLSHTRQGVAIMLKNGAVMHWRGTREVIELDRDIPSSMAVFVPGGPLVLISGPSGLLVEMDTRGVSGVTRFDLVLPQPIGVCSTANRGQFAVLDAKGEMVVY